MTLTITNGNYRKKPVNQIERDMMMKSIFRFMKRQAKWKIYSAVSAMIASAVITIIGIAKVGILQDLTSTVSDYFTNPGGYSVSASTVYKKSSSGYKKCKVKRVVDGDTLLVSYNKKTVYLRMIGIDTPESVHKNSNKNTSWGRKASIYTKSKLKGKTVYLEFDKDKYDRYDRLLAYVYTKKKGKYVMYNKTLVKKGLARAVCYEPNHKYKKVFDKLQNIAKKHKKGFWKSGYENAFPVKE